MWYARCFIEHHLPFWEMIPQDELISSESGEGEVFALPGEIYAIYLPRWGQAKLNLTGRLGNFTTRWYNPRQGEFQGHDGQLSGGKHVDLPLLPREVTEDWTLLVTRENSRWSTKD